MTRRLVVARRALPEDGDHYVGTPLVAFEVLSPSSAARDRRLKLPRFLALGVEEVWLIEPTAEAIERHTQRSVSRVEGGAALTSASIEGFSIAPQGLLGQR